MQINATSQVKVNMAKSNKITDSTKSVPTPVVARNEIKEVPVKKVLYKIDTTIVSSEMKFSQGATYHAEDVALWMNENGFIQDGGCYRGNGMIAHVSVIDPE